MFLVVAHGLSSPSPPMRKEGRRSAHLCVNHVRISLVGTKFAPVSSLILHIHRMITASLAPFQIL